MSKALENLAAAIEDLEQEVGIEETTQRMAEILLAFSTRTVGDAPNSWTVNTHFVSGEVVAITDKALDSV